LLPAGRSSRCSLGHSFDVAKEGYLSLLHGRQTGEGRGDSKAMIQARDRVHRADVFAPLVAALTALPLQPTPRSMLELGCGEGFFLAHLAQAHAIATSYGLDLSVDAVKLAAKAQRASLIVRADLLQPLPFADSSLDLIVSIFAPRPLDEIRRVLANGGHALFVHPHAGHWEELRAFVPLAGIGAEKLGPADLTGFTLVHDQNVTAKRPLTRALIADLVEMSPSIHRLTREGIDWRSQLPEQLEATLAVRVALYRKD
jgi:23S rRNA (guanine745-N1)-methyltransferase